MDKKSTAREVLARRRGKKLPERPIWWKRVRSILLWLLSAIGAIGAIVGLIAVLVQRIPVDLAPRPERAPPFPVEFKLVNSNWFSIVDVTRTQCRQNVVAFESGRVFVSEPGPGGIIIFDSSVANTKRLRSDEPVTVRCTTVAIWGRPTYADITVLVDYRRFFVWKSTKTARFLGRWRQDGTWLWEPKPLDDPEVEPDYSLLVQPPSSLPGPSRDAADGFTPPSTPEPTRPASQPETTPRAASP